MNRYEVIISQEKNIISLMSSGLIPVHILDYKVYYEAYKQQLEAVKKSNIKAAKGEAIGYVSVMYGISERQVQRIIKWMETL